MDVLVPLLIAAPLAVAMAGRALRRPAGSWGPAGGAVSMLLALAVSAIVLTRGPLSWLPGAGSGRSLFGFWADQLAAVLLPVVCGIGLVVQLFARRYLYGDRRADRFFTATAALTAATAALVTAVTVVGLALAWTAAGLALCALLGTYDHLPAARDGLRRTAAAFAVGDGALWAAVLVIVAGSGQVDLRRTAAPLASAGGLPATVAAVLFVLAAASRSAQIPFHRWLPTTLAAPTPVSALLHAGVVNAGAILLARAGTVVVFPAAAMYLTFAVGALTAVYATALMLTKPDIKGALVHSTMGQMGFMIMTCGLGLYAAAVFHLIAHGMYKATLFLGSGAAVHRYGRHDRSSQRAAPSAARRWMLGAYAVTAPAAALALAAALGAPVGELAHHGGVPLLVFAWAAGATAGWAWLRRGPTAGRALAGAVALGVIAPVYLTAVAVLTRILAPALPVAAGHGATGWAVLAAALALAAVAAAMRFTPALPGLAALRRTTYVWALTQAQPRTGTTVRVAAEPLRHRPVVRATVGASA